MEDGFLHLREENGHAQSELLPDELHEYSIEVWADMELGQEQQGLNLVRVHAGHPYDVLKYNLRGEGRWAFQRRRAGFQSAVFKEAEVRGMTQFVMTVGRDAAQVYFGGTNTVLRIGSARYRDQFFEYEPDTTQLTFGQVAPQNPRIFKGKIAEARLFRRVLSAEEVEALRRSNPLSY